MHWLVVDIPNGGALKDGSEKMKFSPAEPPLGTGEHRYILLVFGQKSRIGGKPESFVKERRKFSIAQFAIDNALGDPKFVNVYRTEFEEDKCLNSEEVEEED